MRETPHADKYSIHKLEAEIRESLAEGIPPPDFDEEIERWESEGWPGPVEPLHERLMAWERSRRIIDDPAGWAAVSPDLEWRYGKWSLAHHRVLLANHERELERIQLEERRRR